MHFRFRLHYTIVSYLLLAFTVVFVHATAQRWTEADESKRIADLKREEQRYFESQMGGSLTPIKENSHDYEHDVDLGSPYMNKYASDNSPPTISHSSLSNHQQYRHHKHNSHHHYNHLRARKSDSENGAKKHWCFHCISPWTSIQSEMRQVVLNLLELRRAVPPGSASIASDCTQPRAIDALQRHQCLHSYCQTLVLTDHATGTAFTLRGCAENFGAIDEKLLESRGDNTCKKLHNTVDIQECICKNRKYCYAGDERNLDYIDNYNGGLTKEEDDGEEIGNGEIIKNVKFERHIGRSSSIRSHTISNIILLILTFLYCFVIL